MRDFIMKRVQEHYDLIKDDCEVVGVFLQGSQNYGLDIYEEDYKSDVDTKAILVPKLEDIIDNVQAVSTTNLLSNGELIDKKDIRVMFDNFLKQNVNFIEILFTDYYILNPKYEELFRPVLEIREEIARFDVERALKSQAGMSKQKLKALKHLYPSLLEKIEKFKYDPKQLHHILRMNDFIKKYRDGKPYKECLIPDDKEYLLNIKKGVLSLEEAERLAKETDAETESIAKNSFVVCAGDRKLILSVLSKVKYDIITKYILENM